MEKTISVIIATFNSDAYIGRALESVKNSSYKFVDCIVVDGKSKDKTIDIVRSFQGKINLKFISEKDEGIFDALNKGIKLSNSDYIYVLGSDDELLPNGLADLIYNDDEEDIIYGKVIERNEKGQFYHPKAKSYKMLSCNMPFSHQGMIIKRDLFLKLNGFNITYKLSADFDLVQRAYLKGAAFKYVDCNVAYFSTSGFSRQGIFSVDKEVRKICIANGVYKFISFRHIYYMFRKLVKNILLRFI